MLKIPKTIDSDTLIPFLGQLAEQATSPDLIVDFSNLQRVTPAGLASLTAVVAHRKRTGLETRAVGLEVCVITSFMERMNLLRYCDWESERGSFNRNDSKRMFVPLERITHRVDELGDQVASCIAPGGDDYEHPNAGLYDAAWYLVTEMANNVQQHSRGIGFVAAQTTKSDGLVRIAIADCGCGIPASLTDAGFPWVQDTPDEDIIERAMVARVSSKGQPSNEGVGLTLSSRIIELMGGSLLIASGSGMVVRGSSILKKRAFDAGHRFPGTLIAMSFRRSDAAEFDTKLHKAKELEHLLRGSVNLGNFQP